MIESFRIQNFKSIVDQTIDLGRFNVFIGENGGGKTNVLEAFALGAVAARELLPEVSVESCVNSGLRVARPSMMCAAFSADANQVIQFDWRAADETFSTELVSNDDPGSGAFLTNRPIASFFVGVKAGILTRFLAEIGDSEDKQRERKLFVEAVNSLPANSLHPLMTALVGSAFGGSQTLTATFGAASFVIYAPMLSGLRGLSVDSARAPLGMHGEGLDVHIAQLPEEKRARLREIAKMIGWFEDLEFDDADAKKFQGFKPGRSMSRLYFHDRFMNGSERIFSAENANEGILFVLFYLTLFLSEHTPKFFGIDNLDTALNPKLCRNLVKALVKIAKTENKQALVTTHNPAMLDGLNLNDDEQRLFIVQRNDDGHTTVRRIKTKPSFDGKKMRLSELWMLGHLGGLPTTF